MLRLRVGMLLTAVLLSGCVGSLKKRTNYTVLPVAYFNKEGIVSGYAETRTGQEIIYHSPFSEAEPALIARATDGNSAIEWQTAVCHQTEGRDSVQFIWLAGLGCNLGEKQFTLFVNGQAWGSFYTLSKEKWRLTGKYGTLHFRSILQDQYGDHFGYMRLTLPVKTVSIGKPLHLRAVGEAGNSQAWFMVFKRKLHPYLQLESQPALLRTPSGAKQPCWGELLFLGDSMTVEIVSEQTVQQLHLRFGLNRFFLQFPPVTDITERHVKLLKDQKMLAECSVVQRPVRPMEIHLLHHTHLDIGYTHPQEEVLRLQWRHLENAMKLGQESRSLPEEARFCWNPEQLWAVMAYLEQKSPEAREALLQAIRQGSIAVDALYANLLTGLCQPEELFQAVADAESLRERGIAVESAMITDIPGWTWGLVPVLAQSGIRYLSLGPNSGHRIGHIFALADRPFYWESPSGEERILCWIHGKGYSWFHTGLIYHLKGKLLPNLLTEKRIFPYLRELNEKGYPYDMIPVRYNIGSDNGPPDPTLSDIVAAWNRRYITPKLVISNVASTFRKFEERYGDKLPVVRGDFTPYWEDGAASTARETAMARRAANQLLQAEVLFSLFRPMEWPATILKRAWRHVLLFSEHTWGAWNSISDPDDPFVRNQWLWKQRQALEAKKLADNLLNTICGQPAAEVKSFAVVNSCSWERTDIVSLPPNTVPENRVVVDLSGRMVPQQRLKSGEVIFLAERIPALGMKQFRIDKPNGMSDSGPINKEWASLEFDSVTGSINVLKALDHQWVDTTPFPGLNHYIYVPGRDPTQAQTVFNTSRITVTEDGPLFKEWLVVSEAPGCLKLQRRIRLYKLLKRIDLKNTLMRASVREPEGIHFAFPFQILNGEVRIYSPWAIVRPDKDQAMGANKNWFSVSYGLQISDGKFQVVFVPLDAPLVEIGELSADPIVCGWKEKIGHSQTVFSYVMNNYWETNFKADQPGTTHFEYSLYFQRETEDAALYRLAVGRVQPLRIYWVKPNEKLSVPPIRIQAKRSILTRLQVLSP